MTVVNLVQKCHLFGKGENMDQDLLIRNNISGTFLADIEEIASTPIDWSKLEGKSITITGASGFISSHLVLSLLLR